MDCFGEVIGTLTTAGESELARSALDQSEPMFRASVGARDITVVERFKRVDASTIDYRVTVTAPQTFTRTWTASTPMTKIKGPVFECACHGGTTRLGTS